MEPAGYIVWRRCATRWSVRTGCDGLRARGSSAFPRKCMATVPSRLTGLCMSTVPSRLTGLCMSTVPYRLTGLCMATVPSRLTGLCMATVPSRLTGLCMATVTPRWCLSTVSPFRCCPPLSVPSAPMSPCSGAVPHPGSAFLCTGASQPVRYLCTSPGGMECWRCQLVVSSSELFCPSCSSIQPPDESKDFFQRLDCERSFHIDVQDLQRKYRNLQRLLHPDYFSQKSQREREISEMQSSLVNKAYNTLLSPLSRGIYLLSLHGITITEGGADATFLFEILEISENLDASTEAETEEIGTFVQDKCQSLTENVRTAFDKGDLESAKVLLTKMKYYSNILDQVKKKMIP